jgi:excisionase family DNA binding protein
MQPQQTTSQLHPLPALLTRQDVAFSLSVSMRGVDEAIATGALEIVSIGRLVRIRPSAVEAFIESRISRRSVGRVVRKTAFSTGGNQ